MTRKIDPEQRALRVLRKMAADGNAEAAAAMAVAERRRKRDLAKQAKLDAEQAKRDATRLSRTKMILGPDQPDGYEQRVLDWLTSGETETSPLGARVDREFRSWRDADNREAA